MRNPADEHDRPNVILTGDFQCNKILFGSQKVSYQEDVILNKVSYQVEAPVIIKEPYAQSLLL